jgi:hypothetical protein
LAVSSIVSSFTQFTEAVKQAAGRSVPQEVVNRKAVFIFLQQRFESVRRLHISIIPEIANVSTEKFLLACFAVEKGLTAG